MREKTARRGYFFLVKPGRKAGVGGIFSPARPEGRRGKYMDDALWAEGRCPACLACPACLPCMIGGKAWPKGPAQRNHKEREKKSTKREKERYFAKA